MRSLFSNGPNGDFVCNPYDHLLRNSKKAYLAAPYFTDPDAIVSAVNNGTIVELLIGLNAATQPAAVKKVASVPGLTVRYLTHRFHAKIYIFDSAILVGSANLTDGGMRANREAVLKIDAETDAEVVEEARALFLELWDAGASLTDEKVRSFAAVWKATQPSTFNRDNLIEEELGRVEPVNINVKSKSKNRERIFADYLNRLVLEKYRPAFVEVTDVLRENGLRRVDLATIGDANETNRFLSWVRQTHAAGEDTWDNAPLRAKVDRETLIKIYGEDWKSTKDSKIPEVYFDWLSNIHKLFGSSEALDAADRDALTEGLMSLHAFEAQARFTNGGVKNLPSAFWSANKGDVKPCADQSLIFCLEKKILLLDCMTSCMRPT